MGDQHEKSPAEFTRDSAAKERDEEPAVGPGAPETEEPRTGRPGAGGHGPDAPGPGGAAPQRPAPGKDDGGG